MDPRVPPPFVPIAEHYDRLIDEADDPALPMVGDPFHETGALRDWLAQANGPAFMAAVGDVRGLTLLEVGVGTGRVARAMLERGCARLVGLDCSAKTAARARENLAAWPNVDIRCADIETVPPEGTFDLAYLVWTIFHLADKPRALAHILGAVRPGGRLIISLEPANDVLDYGPRRIRQYPITPDALSALLTTLGCRVAPPVPVEDAWHPGTVLTIIVSAEKG
jgi:SAM-dependent methyltransferase